MNVRRWSLVLLIPVMIAACRKAETKAPAEEWASASGTSAPAGADPDLRFVAQRMGAAIEGYAADNHTYPEARNLDELRSILVGTYAVDGCPPNGHNPCLPSGPEVTVESHASRYIIRSASGATLLDSDHYGEGDPIKASSITR